MSVLNNIETIGAEELSEMKELGPDQMPLSYMRKQKIGEENGEARYTLKEVKESDFLSPTDYANQFAMDVRSRDAYEATGGSGPAVNHWGPEKTIPVTNNTSQAIVLVFLNRSDLIIIDKSELSIPPMETIDFTFRQLAEDTSQKEIEFLIFRHAAGYLEGWQREGSNDPYLHIQPIIDGQVWAGDYAYGGAKGYYNEYIWPQVQGIVISNYFPG
jgi:hypothetical protein